MRKTEELHVEAQTAVAEVTQKQRSLIGRVIPRYLVAGMPCIFTSRFWVSFCREATMPNSFNLLVSFYHEATSH